MFAPDFSAAFPRLHLFARRLLARERRGHTLQPTALVSETFLRLHRLAGSIHDEDHLFRLSSRIMSRILIDYARTRGSAVRVSADEIPELLASTSSAEAPQEIALDVRDAFDRLRALDRTAADALWLRAVEGCTIDEVAAHQQRDRWRVRADCDYAVEWLAGELRRELRR